jgi:hypothetical protein
MVDVGGKEVTDRTATATGRVDLSPECVALLRGFEAGTGGVPKGDALGVARVPASWVPSGPRTWCRSATRSRCPGSRSTSSSTTAAWP